MEDREGGVHNLLKRRRQMLEFSSMFLEERTATLGCRREKSGSQGG
jgi:hypothetical protein